MTQIPRARGERQGGQRDTESTARTRPVLTKFKGQGETCTTAGQDRSVQSRNTGMQRSCPQRLLRGASSRPRDGVLLLLGETLALPPLPLPLLRLIPVRSATLRHSLDARAWPGLKPTTGHVWGRSIGAGWLFPGQWGQTWQQAPRVFLLRLALRCY